MDIICARCGKHFSDIEAAKEHSRSCKENSEGGPIHWIPAPKSKITPEEWENLMKLINPDDISPPKRQSNIEPTAIEPTISKEPAKPDVTIPSAISEKSNRILKKKEVAINKRRKTGNYKIQNWLIAILLIFALCIVGLGISIFIGNFMPLWLMLGFSFIFSIEKWSHYYTRRHKGLGKLYRSLLNLSILSLLGLLIWTGIKLFSQQFVQSSLIGSLIFIVELILFIWMWRVVSRNSWRWPSMKLTVFSLVVLFLILAFAGVQPMSDYKDILINKWSTFWQEQRLTAEENRAQAIIEEQKRLEEQRIAKQKEIAEQKAQEAQTQFELNQSYAQLFNNFRIQNGKQPLTFDARLNELAEQRAIEISQPGNFNHEGIEKYNVGENIAMMAYSTDSNTELLELWANSPGHRSNMLSSMYARTGFARVGRYAVQIFD